MLSDPLEGILLIYLNEKKSYSTQFFNDDGIIPEDFIKFAESKSLILDSSGDEIHFREAFWRLVGKGLVVPGTAVRGGMRKLPWVSISTYGVKCVESGNLLVHDPREYLSSLQKQIPNLDKVIEMYVAEALSSFLNRDYLASSVMIGGALEKTIFYLTEAFGDTLKDRKAMDYKKDVLSQHKAKTRLNKFLVFLDNNGYKKSLDQPTKEKLESLLPAVANIIRITRNEVGHPTGRVIDPDEAEANLLLAKAGIIFSYELLAKI